MSLGVRYFTVEVHIVGFANIKILPLVFSVCKNRIEPTIVYVVCCANVANFACCAWALKFHNCTVIEWNNARIHILSTCSLQVLNLRVVWQTRYHYLSSIPKGAWLSSRAPINHHLLHYLVGWLSVHLERCQREVELAHFSPPDEEHLTQVIAVRYHHRYGVV